MKFTLYTNSLINFADSVGWRLRSVLWKVVIKFLCILQGIHIGHGCNFYGKMKFMKVKSGSISIGNKCSFRSAHTSNLIGVNRPCIVSALESDAVISIGNNCGFSGTVIGCFKKIRIGNNVKCGANTLITDSNWHQDDYRAGKAKPIEIKDNVWLGEGVKVLKGVTIGENSVIGAGSVVTKNILANVIAAGNPCKEIKPLV
jgi:acetyltransferase-like isoleucine patch superfamily enzyme